MQDLSNNASVIDYKALIDGKKEQAIYNVEH